MSIKRQWSTVSSDSSESPPTTKRRKTDTNANSFLQNSNPNQNDRNDQKHKKANSDKENEYVFHCPKSKNLDHNRISTKHSQIKSRILSQTPSPTTSPDCSSSNESIDLDNISSNFNQSPKRSILFDDDTNMDINIENEGINEGMNEGSNQWTNEGKIERIKAKEINEYKIYHSEFAMNNNDSFDTISEFDMIGSKINDYNHMFRNDKANGLCFDYQTLQRRKAFRNYVLVNIFDYRKQSQSICLGLAFVFGLWSIFNLFCFEYYGDMNVTLALIILLAILKDLSECNNNYGLILMIICTFLVRKCMEFAYVIYDGNGAILVLCNDLIIFVSLTAMVYFFVFDMYYWNAIQERVFNRGDLRRMIAYLIYFWFNAYMTVELMHGLHKTNIGNYVVVYGFVAVVVCLWFKLQNTRYIAVEQFKVNEFCGFIVLICVNYVICFGELGYEKDITDDFSKYYVTLMLCGIILLHKCFRF